MTGSLVKPSCEVQIMGTNFKHCLVVILFFLDNARQRSILYQQEVIYELVNRFLVYQYRIYFRYLNLYAFLNLSNFQKLGKYMLLIFPIIFVLFSSFQMNHKVLLWYTLYSLEKKRKDSTKVDTLAKDSYEKYLNDGIKKIKCVRIFKLF